MHNKVDLYGYIFVCLYVCVYKGVKYKMINKTY